MSTKTCIKTLLLASLACFFGWDMRCGLCS